MLGMPPHYLADPRVLAIRDRAAAWLARGHADAASRGLRFGMKDPRVTRLLPFWDAVLADIGVTPRFVYCVRDPAQVARSLFARDRLPVEQGEYRWLAYNLAAVAGIGRRPVCVLPYESWFADGPATLTRLADWVGCDPAAAGGLLATVEGDLRHDSPAAAGPLVTRLYQALTEDQERPGISPQLRGLCAWLGDFERQAQPLLSAAEVLRVGLGEQRRVIADLTAALQELRASQAA